MSTRKLLLFRACGRVFAVDAGVVREILPASPATRIPGAPVAVRGLVNVRGTLVTVVDAALAIGLADAPAAGGAGAEGAGAAGTLVLLELRSCPVGLVVDEVLDLLEVGDRALAPGPAEGVRPGVAAATGAVGGEPFVELAADVLLEPLLA